MKNQIISKPFFSEELNISEHIFQMLQNVKNCKVLEDMQLLVNNSYA